MFYHMFVLLMLTFTINGLFLFEKREFERQQALLQIQPTGADLWIEQKLDNFQSQDNRKWMQVGLFALVSMILIAKFMSIRVSNVSNWYLIACCVYTANSSNNI